MQIDFSDLKEPTISLGQIKAYLFKVVRKMDADSKEDSRLGVPPENDIVRIRVLMDLGKYDCLKELYYDIVGSFPKDDEIRSWKDVDKPGI